MMIMLEDFLEQFQQVMSNRPVAIAIMVSAAMGAVVTIAGGFYYTYQLVTLIQN